jgi:hypothetical protein
LTIPKQIRYMETATASKFELLTGRQSVDNYPYGRLRCTMYFEVEYVSGKGYRCVTQSINPKNGMLNKPHKSTYSHFSFMVRNNENGHIEFKGFSFYDYDSIIKAQALLKQYNFKFTHKESQDLWALAITCIRGNARYTRLKDGVTTEQFLDATKVREMIIRFKENRDFNDIQEIDYDLDAINSLKAER